MAFKARSYKHKQDKKTNKGWSFERAKGWHSTSDEGTTNKRGMDPIQVPIGPVTRARAKRFKETLNELIQRFWAKESSWRSKRDVKSVLQDWMSVVQTVE